VPNGTKINIITQTLTRAGTTSGYLVQLDKGGERWISSLQASLSDDEATHKAHVAEVAECDRRGGIRIGMTREQLYASCWGKPRSINKTIGGGGVHEQLVYPGNNYVYLENGVVRTIQTSEH
jgi:hypothetical protein